MDVLNVPKPTSVIGWPFFSDLVMPSISESTAAAAPVLDIPVSPAIFEISSCLFMMPPKNARSRRHAQCSGYTRPVSHCQARWPQLRGFLGLEMLDRFRERVVGSWR